MLPVAAPPPPPAPDRLVDPPPELLVAPPPDRLVDPPPELLLPLSPELPLGPFVGPPLEALFTPQALAKTHTPTSGQGKRHAIGR
jgi:hypothetical protein